jgi:hypothetical protein
MCLTSGGNREPDSRLSRVQNEGGQRNPYPGQVHVSMVGQANWQLRARLIPVLDLSRMLMQAMSISCKILGLGVFGGLYLFQSSSIPQASAIAQKASEASKKTLTSTGQKWPKNIQKGFLKMGFSSAFWNFLRSGISGPLSLACFGLLLAQTFSPFFSPFLVLFL